MRTAEEILKSHYYTRQDPEINIDDMIVMINEARKEAIEECAKKAKTKWDFGHKEIESAYVDKQSILSLIKELK